MDLEKAKLLRERIEHNPDKIEYVCRASLLLYNLNQLAECPFCRYTREHSWHCDLAGALEMLDDLLNARV